MKYTLFKAQSTKFVENLSSGIRDFGCPSLDAPPGTSALRAGSILPFDWRRSGLEVLVSNITYPGRLVWLQLKGHRTKIMVKGACQLLYSRQRSLVEIFFHCNGS